VRRVCPTEKKPRGSPLGKKAKWNDLGSWSVFVKNLIFSKNHLKNTNATQKSAKARSRVTQAVDAPDTHHRGREDYRCYYHGCCC
jgi:hypothetical protein